MLRTTAYGFVGCAPEASLKCTHTDLQIQAEVCPAFEIIRNDYQLMGEQVGALARLPADKLKERRTQADAALHELQMELEAFTTRWMEQAAEIQALMSAEKVQAVRYPESTENKWLSDVRSGSPIRRSISNHVFSATLTVAEEFTHKRGQGRIKVWYVSYYVAVNLRIEDSLNNGRIIKSVDRKRFTDLEAAQKYVEGRQSDLDKTYFYSLDPVIPRELRPLYLINGVEMPGYTYVTE